MIACGRDVPSATGTAEVASAATVVSATEVPAVSTVTRCVLPSRNVLNAAVCVAGSQDGSK